MCHYITLVVDGIAPSDAHAFMRRHGREAQASSNRSIASLLEPGELQYLTNRSNCDCGSALLPRPGADIDAEKREAAKLLRKGWSQAKIDRALADRQANAEHRPQHHPDSVALWFGILRELLEHSTVRRAGLLIHNYAGLVDDENFPARRQENRPGEIESRLSDFQEDVLQMFTKARDR